MGKGMGTGKGPERGGVDMRSSTERRDQSGRYNVAKMNHRDGA